MFKEYDCITLTARIPPDRIWEVREDSPLREADGSIGWLRPGDTGAIIDMPPGHDILLVEFTELDEPRPVAFAYVHPHEARREMEGDRARYRFWKNAAPAPVDEVIAP